MSTIKELRRHVPMIKFLGKHMQNQKGQPSPFIAPKISSQTPSSRPNITRRSLNDILLSKKTSNQFRCLSGEEISSIEVKDR
jgi:hypothetical protein